MPRDRLQRRPSRQQRPVPLRPARGAGAALPGGTNCYQYTNVGGSPAGNTAKYHPIGIVISALEDGSGASGAMARSLLNPGLN